MQLFGHGLFVTLLLMASTAVRADWHLLPEQSHIAFTSVKAETIGENHHFTSLEGLVDEAGQVTIRVPLASVDTGIDIRNQRMQDFLFEVAQHPTAALTAQIDLGLFRTLKPGEQRDILIEEATLSLHGVESPVTLDLLVTRLSESRALVTTRAPLLVDADYFELSGGIAKLRELAGLDAIDLVVPVTASLLFDAN